MNTRALAGTALVVALMLAPMSSSANHFTEHTVGDTTVGVEDGQGCYSVYIIKPDQGYHVVAVGGNGIQRKEGKPGSRYHPHPVDPEEKYDPDESICPSDQAEENPDD